MPFKKIEYKILFYIFHVVQVSSIGKIRLNLNPLWISDLEAQLVARLLHTEFESHCEQEFFILEFLLCTPSNSSKLVQMKSTMTYTW